MYGEEDIMSQTQSQEELPLGQQSQATKNAVKEEQLQKAKKKFNDNLIVKNNQTKVYARFSLPWRKTMLQRS